MYRYALQAPNMKVEPGHPDEDAMFQQMGELQAALNLAGIGFSHDMETFFTIHADGEDISVKPGDWLLFTRTGLVVAESVTAWDLEADDQIAGFNANDPADPADFWDCVITLASRPRPGNVTVVYTPTADGTIPDTYNMGSVYAPVDWPVFKVLARVAAKERAA